MTDSNTFGMKIFDGSGTDASNTLVKLGGDGNEIAGWTVTNDALTGGAMIIRQDGTIESSGFASNVAGSGFRLTAANGGFLEVENAKIRGTMSTTVFEKESVNAVGGQLYVANSTTIKSGSVVTATQTTMSVDNASGFSANEILSVKKVTDSGFSTEYMLVESASIDNSTSFTDFSGKLFVQRGYSGSLSTESGSVGDGASTATFYSGSQVIVSTGQVGTGYIRLNANPNDPTTPYIDIVERTGSAIYDVELKARLGDLSGLSSGLLFGETSPGFGLFTENVFLQGAITATTGSITGILHVDTSDTQKVKIGKDVSGTNDGIHINDVNYWYTTGNFKIGDSAGNFVSSSGEISTDKLEVDAGTGDLQISSTELSMSFADGDLLLKKDGNDASITVGGTATKQITILGSNTQGYISSGKTSVSDETSGFWLANNNATQEFHIGDSTSAIKYDGSNIFVTASQFELDAGDGDVQISATQASMSLGQRTIELIGDQANQEGRIRVGSNDIKNLQITGSTTTGIIKSVKDDFTDTTAGIWIANNDGVQEFHIGDVDQYIKFDSTSGNLQIQSDSIQVTASDVDITTGVFLLDSDDFQVSSVIPSMSFGYDTTTDSGITITAGSTNEILFGSKTSPDMKLHSDGTDAFLSIGTIAFGSETNAGILIGNENGNAELRLYKDEDEFFTYDATDGFDLRTTSFRVNTEGFDISGTSGTGTSNFLKLGDATSATDGEGVYLDGGGNFRVGTATSGTSFMRYNPTSEELQVKTSNLNIDTTTMDIVASGSATRLSMGASPPTDFSSNGIILSGSGYFNLQAGVSDYIRNTSSGFDLKSQNFDLDAGTIIMDSGTSNGVVKLGSSATNITETANTGIYMDGDGNFRVGEASGSGGSYIYFDGSDLDIKSQVFKLDTSNLDIDSDAGGSGSIALGSTPPTAYNSGTGFFVDGSGKLLIGDTSGGHIKWNGSTLEVTGTININNFDSDFGSQISGSSNALSGSVSGEIGALQEGSSSMATQVVLSSGGMDLKNAAADTTLASYGATTTIGVTSTEHVEITSTSLKLKDDTTELVSISGTTVVVGSDTNNRVTITPTSMQIGSTANGITMDANGDATFNGEITISSGLASSISGSSNALSSSFSDEVDALQEGSSSMATQVVLNSDGMELQNAAGTTTLASYGTTTTIGQDANDQSRIFIDSDSVDLIVDTGGTDVTEASFGATTTIGGTSGQHISIDNDSFDVKTNASTTVASFGSTTTIGDTSGEHISISADAFEVKTSSTNTVLSASSAGLEMEGTIKASGGTIGGWSIGTDTISGGNTTLNDNGTITLGSTANTSVAGTDVGIYMDAGGDFLVYGTDTNLIRFDVSEGDLDIQSEKFELKGLTVTASADDAYIRVGSSTNRTAWTGSEGIWLSGSGEFNLQSGSQFIRNIGIDGGMEMDFGNFSVSTDGTLVAQSASFTNAVISGEVRAQSGFFGSSNAGWQIDGDSLTDVNSVISLTPGSGSVTSSISLTNLDGDFRAEIVPEYSTAEVVLSSGGNSYNGGSQTSTTVSAPNTPIGNGDTESYTGNDLYGYYDNDNSDAFTVETRTTNPAGSELSAGKEYKTTFKIRTQITLNTSVYDPNNNYYTLGVGNGTVTGRLMSTSGAVQSFTQAVTLHAEEVTSTSTVLTFERTFTVIHTPASTEDFWVEIEDFSVTNTNLTQYFTVGTKLNSQQLTISAATTTIKEITHQPSNKITQIAPKGFQTINLGEADLEHADNTYVRTDVEGSKTLDILGDTFISGSLNIKKRSTTATADSVTINPSVTAQISASSAILAGQFQLDSGNDTIRHTSAGSAQGMVFKVANTDRFLMDNDGDFHARADLVGFTSTFSDIKFKENVNPIENALYKVQQLRGVTFDWKGEYSKRGNDIGFIAQEIEQVKGLEALVSEKNNFITNEPSKVVHYNKVVSLLVEAIKEQQIQIDDMKSEIEDLKNGNHD